MESEFGIVDLVVDIFLETVVSAVHPCNVRVTLLVNTDGGVERIGIVNGHTGVVDNHEVTVGASTGVLSVGAALGGVAWQSGCEARVVVHLGVGVKNGHVDFTRVVGGDVDHGFYEEGHLVGSGAGWELVSLSTSVGVRKCVSWAVSCLGRNDAVWTLDEVHEVGLDVSCTAVALAVESDWNHAGKETVVVGFLNGCLVVCLL